MMSKRQHGDRQWLFAPYLLVAPVLLYYTMFWLHPVGTALVGSFQDAEAHFTFANYLTIFRDPVFPRALLNTCAIVAVSVTLEFVVAFGLALLISKRFAGAGLFLALALIPMALPPVAVGAIWSSGLASYGWLNSLLTRAGLLEGTEKIAFLGGGAGRAIVVIVLIDAWQVIPFMMIILLAGMQNLQCELREAGYVFGGTPWRVLRSITIPLLRPTIQTAVLLRLISAVQIWLIIVMLYGFRTVPVLLEEVMFYQEQLTGPEHRRVALAYAVLVAGVVSAIAVAYIRLSTRRDRSTYAAA